MNNVQFFLKQANVLIFSDCCNNAAELTEILTQKGYNNIKHISNGELTIKYVKENLPDIILLDISTDENSGYELCKIFKSDLEVIEIPIIIIGTDSINKEKLFVLGGADYLSFPFSTQEVIARIETHLMLKFLKLENKKLKGESGSSYKELEKVNERLIYVNEDLQQRVFEKNQQLEEITKELKEFNVTLEEEINERTKTEEALKESERQFRYSLQEAPVPIMLYTDDGKVKKINRTWREITGYTIEDIPTISGWAEMSEVFTSDLRGINMIKLFTSEKRQNDGEYLIKTRDQSTRIWNFYSAYIGELQDGHKLFMRIAIDITEQKYMEEVRRRVDKEIKSLNEIREYDRIKTEFFSNISHELRTPINLIFSTLQMQELKLKDCPLPDESMKRYIKIMKQNCYRILRLINNIIDITKIDSGYFDINEKNVNVINLIENITLSVADYVENKGLSLIFDTELEEKIIACDPDKIERVILNLLSNAVKFTSFGGTIDVNIEDCIEKICIRIKDTGRGVPKEKLNSIFERFIQVDKSLTRDHEGSGIGLSLVKSLIELHGGTISVESTVGIGTEFIIYMPCRVVEDAIEEFSFGDSIDKNIEKINIEFSDIYN